MHAPIANKSTGGLHLVLIALGNIGSKLVREVACMPEAAKVTLIGKDIYEQNNLASQDIMESDIGHPKVEVHARFLRELRPQLEVVALHEPVERIPIGLLRSDLILTCLDVRTARQWVNQVACLLQVPWLDAGINIDAHLVRMTAYRPGPDRPCLECSWDKYEEYEPGKFPCSVRVELSGTEQRKTGKKTRDIQSRARLGSI